MFPYQQPTSLTLTAGGVQRILTMEDIAKLVETGALDTKPYEDKIKILELKLESSMKENANLQVLNTILKDSMDVMKKNNDNLDQLEKQLKEMMQKPTQQEEQYKDIINNCESEKLILFHLLIAQTAQVSKLKEELQEMNKVKKEADEQKKEFIKVEIFFYLCLFLLGCCFAIIICH